MTAEFDSIAANALNCYRVELGDYKIKVDDPLLSMLKKECALVESEIEVIQSRVTSAAKMSHLIDYLTQRLTRETFRLFAECVGSVMNMPDLQQKLLKDVEKVMCM